MPDADCKKVHELRNDGQRIWVALDLNNPVVRWNVAVGVLQSPLLMKQLDSDIITFFMASRLKNPHLLELEMCELELVRFMEFPEKISRLQGLFFFDDEHEFEKVKYMAPFNRCKLVECSIEPGAYSKHDMNWITYYESIKNRKDWAQSYWKGETCPYSEHGCPVWECITNKTILVLDQELKQALYDEWISQDDAYGFLLQMGNMAVVFGYAIGNCFYRIVREKSHLHIRFFMRFPEDECINVIKEMAKDPKWTNNGKAMFRQINKYYPEIIGISPDFRQYDWCVTNEQKLTECDQFHFIKN